VIPSGQWTVVLGLHIVEADHSGAAGTFKVSMLMRIYIDVRTETPYTIVPHDPVDIVPLVQPFEHAIECYPVQSVLILKTLFDFVMADSPLFRQEHGKDLHPPGSHPLSPAPDHLFRLLLKADKHKGRIATKLRYYNWVRTFRQFLLLGILHAKIGMRLRH